MIGIPQGFVFFVGQADVASVSHRAGICAGGVDSVFKLLIRSVVDHVGAPTVNTWLE